MARFMRSSPRATALPACAIFSICSGVFRFDPTSFMLADCSVRLHATEFALIASTMNE